MKGYVVCSYTYLKTLHITRSRQAAEAAYIFEADTESFGGGCEDEKIAAILSHEAQPVSTITALDVPFATPYPHHARVWLDDDGIASARAFLQGKAEFWNQPLAGRIFVTGPTTKDGDDTSALIDASALTGMFQPVTRMAAQDLFPGVRDIRIGIGQILDLLSDDSAMLSWRDAEIVEQLGFALNS